MPHPRTQELLTHLEHHRGAVRAALEMTPSALRDRSPAPERWSVAEVLEHLAIVERQVAGLLKRGLRLAQQDAPLPAERCTDPVLPTVDGEALLDRERKLVAGQTARPSRFLSADQAWLELEASRAMLCDVVLAADGLATDGVVAEHPFLGPLTFLQWVAFVGFHESRHAAQIRETAAALGGAHEY
ncbi:MAG: DinB family protein [Planctomycetes bacterium]|nr:DinB family protein [Planctomycetota bacterium]